MIRAYDDEMVARNQGATGSQARHINDFIDAIATRAAEQLATGGLSDVDRVRLRSVRELLDRQPDVWDLEANLIDRIIGASK